MAFTPESAKTPTTIGDIRITLYYPVDSAKSADYVIRVHDQDGNPMSIRRGDLVPHLTAGQITQIQQFLDDMRAEAEDKILP
jgi:hypothetical protein